MFEQMKKSLEQVLRVVADDLLMVRAGRAKPEIIENVQVEAYEGPRWPFKELASVTAPDPHMLMIQPWDQSVLKKIEIGIQKSDLHLNPVVDGNMIRINIPPLTEERRRDLVKLTRQKLESGHEMMRGVRNETKKEIDAQKGKPGVSEDDMKNWLKELQEVFEVYVAKLEEMGKRKETELMEL